MAEKKLERKKWVRKRFGNIPEEILGKIDEIEEITWPWLNMDYERKEGKFSWRSIGNIKNSAERIAEIYRNAIDEMAGNEEYEWHHDPEEIIKRVQSGDYNIYGCYWRGELILVVSAHIIQGQRAIHWIWGAVDPAYRGLGVWHELGLVIDAITERSGAQFGFFWVATTHNYSQQTAERAGFKPIGCFVGGEFMGGSDGRYYRQTVVYYAKLYGEKHLQKWDDMKLTEMAKKAVDPIKEIWENNQ